MTLGSKRTDSKRHVEPGFIRARPKGDEGRDGMCSHPGAFSLLLTESVPWLRLCVCPRPSQLRMYSHVPHPIERAACRLVCVTSLPLCMLARLLDIQPSPSAYDPCVGCLWCSAFGEGDRPHGKVSPDGSPDIPLREVIALRGRTRVSFTSVHTLNCHLMHCM